MPIGSTPTAERRVPPHATANEEATRLPAHAVDGLDSTVPAQQHLDTQLQREGIIAAVLVATFAIVDDTIDLLNKETRVTTHACPRLHTHPIARGPAGGTDIGSIDIQTSRLHATQQMHADRSIPVVAATKAKGVEHGVERHRSIAGIVDTLRILIPPHIGHADARPETNGRGHPTAKGQRIGRTRRLRPRTFVERGDTIPAHRILQEQGTPLRHIGRIATKPAPTGLEQFLESTRQCRSRQHIVKIVDIGQIEAVVDGVFMPTARFGRRREGLVGQHHIRFDGDGGMGTGKELQLQATMEVDSLAAARSTTDSNPQQGGDIKGTLWPITQHVGRETEQVVGIGMQHCQLTARTVVLCCRLPIVAHTTTDTQPKGMQRRELLADMEIEDAERGAAFIGSRHAQLSEAATQTDKGLGVPERVTEITVPVVQRETQGIEVARMLLHVVLGGKSHSRGRQQQQDCPQAQKTSQSVILHHYLPSVSAY